MDADIFRFENNRLIRGQSSGNQVLDHFVLRVNGAALTAGECAKIDPVPASVEAQFDSAMLQAMPLQPLAQSEFMHQVNSALFQYAGADSFFDVLAGM